MASWGSSRSSTQVRQLQTLVVGLTERLAIAEQVVEAVEQDAHFRLDSLEAAA